VINVAEIERGREAFESARLGDDRFRLDSGGEAKWSRWSYRAGPPSLKVISDSSGQTILRGATFVRRWSDPLEALQWIGTTLNRQHIAGPPFKGGWLGYLSYDLGRWFEKLPQQANDDLKLPLFCFTWHNQVLAHDSHSGRNYLCTCQSPEESGSIDLREEALATSASVHRTFSRQSYQLAVQKVLDYIAAGDVFQVNLAQRFAHPMKLTPRAVYQRLCGKFPAGFGALLDYGQHALISNSPELFLEVDENRKVITRPIKGTRPRRQGMEQELRESLKDQAELNMIVDLERNDLGRVCEIGSIEVVSPREIEAHPTVYHGVATIEGTLREDVGLVELLRATFPGGSVTGAPKIRAMQIIDELEPVRRGPYCGAIGYLSADGQIGLNIAIRTIVVNQGTAYVSVGGGIVADSKPAAEYEETLVKAKAMFDALGVESIPQ
jgi:aminodeoxychorismate synthase component I